MFRSRSVSTRSWLCDPRRVRRLLALTLATISTWLAPGRADAFCGFFVGHADAALGNRATSVVLMRDGTRTVLSMRNDYTGPLADFAMIVPVPVVLRSRDVKTLPHDIFDKLERMTAPRLVEYWEEDPCAPSKGVRIAGTSGAESRYVVDNASFSAYGVRVLTRFQTGEYDVEVLSARDSLGLATWLRASGYKLPPGADEALRPYVQAGMKFFAAKVAIDRTRRDSTGRVTLSPLRFHYESDGFSLPIRLGLLNSVGVQDLIVHILGKQRYQAANRPNLAIPTNLDVTAATSGAFSQFYAALFDRTVQANPGAVVTEHAWTLSVKCDPCTAARLDWPDLATLGGDLLWSPQRARPIPLEPNKAPTGAVEVPDDDPFQPTVQRGEIEAGSRPKYVGDWRWPYELVVTRLHLRYGAADLGEDLVLQPAPPIAGGQEGDVTPQPQGPRTTGVNRFQARYAIRHAWDGPIKCTFPWRGRWGGSPPISGQSLDSKTPKIATDLAFVARDAALTTFLVGEPPRAEPLQAQPQPVTPPLTGPTRCDTGGGGLLGLLLLRRRRRRSSS